MRVQTMSYQEVGVGSESLNHYSVESFSCKEQVLSLASFEKW